MEFIRKFDCELTGTEVHIYQHRRGKKSLMLLHLENLKSMKTKKK